MLCFLQVSALKCGLLAMSQEALICGNVSYHDFHGVAVDADERERLARNLGVHNKVSGHKIDFMLSYIFIVGYMLPLWSCECFCCFLDSGLIVCIDFLDDIWHR